MFLVLLSLPNFDLLLCHYYFDFVTGIRTPCVAPKTTWLFNHPWLQFSFSLFLSVFYSF